MLRNFYLSTVYNFESFGMICIKVSICENVFIWILLIPIFIMFNICYLILLTHVSVTNCLSNVKCIFHVLISVYLVVFATKIVYELTRNFYLNTVHDSKAFLGLIGNCTNWVKKKLAIHAFVWIFISFMHL